MKNAITKTLLCLTFLAAAFIVARDARLWTIAHAQSGGWTITMNLYDTSSGAEVFLRPTVYATRSDGTHVHLANLGERGQPIRQIAFSDGRGLILYDGIHAKVWHIPEKLADLKTQAQIAAAHNGPCEYSIGAAKKISDEVLMGYKVTVVDQQDDPNIRMRFWMAPEFGCMAIQYQVERLNKNGTFNRTVIGRATNIRVGAPDSRLFDLGDKYEVVSREEAQARGKRLADALRAAQ